MKIHQENNSRISLFQTENNDGSQKPATSKVGFSEHISPLTKHVWHRQANQAVRTSCFLQLFALRPWY